MPRRATVRSRRKRPRNVRGCVSARRPERRSVIWLTVATVATRDDVRRAFDTPEHDHEPPPSSAESRCHRLHAAVDRVDDVVERFVLERERRDPGFVRRGSRLSLVPRHALAVRAHGHAAATREWDEIDRPSVLVAVLLLFLLFPVIAFAVLVL